MTPKTVWAVYFSGTGTTERTVRSLAGELARMLSVPCRSIDFTRPQARQKELSFCERDLVVFGTPVYAGRVPNVLLPYLREKVRGGGALAVPVVLFGNRNYDDALIELRDLLQADGFGCIAAGAFVGEHSFSRTLGAGRPDDRDMAGHPAFAREICGKLAGQAGTENTPVAVRGETPIRPYYTPRDRHGNPISILKVKPKTDMAKCGGCGLCADNCPAGAIPKDAPKKVDKRKCISCMRCIQICPQTARSVPLPLRLAAAATVKKYCAGRKEPAFYI